MFAGTPKILLSLTFHKHYKIDNVMYQSQFLFVEHFPQCLTLEIAFTYYSLGSSTLHTMQQDLPWKAKCESPIVQFSLFWDLRSCLLLWALHFPFSSHSEPLKCNIAKYMIVSIMIKTNFSPGNHITGMKVIFDIYRADSKDLDRSSSKRSKCTLEVKYTRSKYKILETQWFERSSDRNNTL